MIEITSGGSGRRTFAMTEITSGGERFFGSWFSEGSLHHVEKGGGSSVWCTLFIAQQTRRKQDRNQRLGITPRSLSLSVSQALPSKVFKNLLD